MDIINMFVAKATSLDKSSSPKSQLQKFDFLRLVTPDLNGIHLSKLVSTRHADKILNNQYDAFVGVIAIDVQCGMIAIQEVVDSKYCNGSFRPCLETLRPLPWGGTPQSSVGEVICETLWPDGSPVLAHPRLVARKQLEELEKLGYVLNSAFEPEFRVFTKDSSTGRYKPANPHANFYKTGVAVQFEKLFIRMEKMFQIAGIDVQDYIVENGAGQLETPLLPKYGIEAADMAFSYRQAVKEIGQLEGYKVSFMAKPLPNESGSGWHFNHSLVSAATLEPVLYDDTREENLSQVMLHWLGGLMEHQVALSALTSPTVNCYRRLHKGLSPDKADWDINNRFASVRVKNGSPKGTYVELRTVSSAACPYHVLAATVAAGIDGLKRKLLPPPAEDKNAAPLPYSFDGALTLFENDEILVQALGRQFVDWFLKLKREGCLAKLKNVDLQKEDDESLEMERERYFDFI